MAVYSVAIQLTQMFMMFSTAISGVFLPKVTAMVTYGGNEKEISDLFIRTGRIQYIVMSFILSAFVVFGRPFIRLWAGEGYEEAYYVSLLFFFSLLIPLIQNLGITILQARNQMRFRSVCYVIIAFCCLAFSIYGTRKWGMMGCAYATAGALLLGQGLVMNIYYKGRQGIDISRFWCEIGRMSIMPVIFVILCLWTVNHWEINLTIPVVFIYSVAVFVVLYALLFWFMSMNAYERNLFISPLKK